MPESDRLVTLREVSVYYTLSRNAVARWVHQAGLKPERKNETGRPGHPGFLYCFSEIERVFGPRRRALRMPQWKPATEESWARLCEVLDDVMAGRCWPKRHWEVFEHSERQFPRNRRDKAV